MNYNTADVRTCEVAATLAPLRFMELFTGI